MGRNSGVSRRPVVVGGVRTARVITATEKTSSRSREQMMTPAQIKKRLESFVDDIAVEGDSKSVMAQAIELYRRSPDLFYNLAVTGIPQVSGRGVQEIKNLASIVQRLRGVVNGFEITGASGGMTGNITTRAPKASPISFYGVNIADVRAFCEKLSKTEPTTKASRAFRIKLT